MNHIILIAHNVRSTHNVGSLLRTANGLGIEKVYLTGYTPYPLANNDKRLPHLAAKLDRQIAKTALGAEKTTAWQYQEDLFKLISDLKVRGYVVAALEQTKDSIDLADYKSPSKLALVVGREVEGLETEVLDVADLSLEIPMKGTKESFNVSIAAGIALYTLKNKA